MKNIITSIVLLITLFIVFLACTEDEPKKETPSDVTDDTTSVAETTETEETTVPSNDDVVTPTMDIEVYYDNGIISFSDDLLAVTDGVVCFYLEANAELAGWMVEKVCDIVGKERFTVTQIKYDDNVTTVIACFGEERKYVEEICIDVGIGTFEIADVLCFVSDDCESYSNIKRIAINDAIINVEYGNHGFLFASSICAYGHTAELKKSEAMHGNVNNYVHQTEDTFVINFDEEWGVVYIFTKDDYVAILPNDIDRETDPDFYNVSFYNYEVDENGRLTYSRRPYKYTMNGGCFNGMVEYCCGYAELWMEIGVVSVENGEVVYTPERQYTVKEGIEDFEGIYSYHTQVNYIPIEEYYEEYYREELEKKLGVRSLEELIEYNKAHYEVYS